jgi:amidohydrolase
MKKITAPTVLVYLLAGPAMAQQANLVDTYKGLHAHPELSHHEEHTAGLLAAELRNSGYTVTERVGKYPDGTQAYGVVAILENGRGPKLLIRADMDALPIVEETGVTYASQVKGVMHACGHDVHVATMIGTARALAAAKAKWHGTLMLVGQPSEETIDGARAMLADHLYERFGTPDLAVALHDSNSRAAGTVSVTSGPALTSATSVDVVLRGIGAHGAQPQAGKDPIVMAGEFIVQLQTIVSRQENPRDPAIVTIGSIHGGTKRNIIPNEVRMEITARAYTDKSRQVIVDGIRRTAQGVALSAGVPEELAPIVTVLDAESTPVMYNDPKLTARVRAALIRALGAKNVIDEEPGTASEDFGFFGLEGRKIPTMMFGLGAIDPGKFAAAAAEGKLVPGPHNSRFEPAPEPTLRTGVTAMSAVAIDLLQ